MDAEESAETLGKIPTSNPKVYRRNGVKTYPNASTSRVSDQQSQDDIWEQLKRPVNPPPGPMPQPAVPFREKLAKKPDSLGTKKLQDEQAEEFQTLAISKAKLALPVASTSRSDPLPIKRKSPANPYDFDDEEESNGGGLSSSQGSSSQGSNSSTGSVKGGPVRKKLNGASDAVFRKPARPAVKPKPGTAAVPRPPALKRGETFPPSRKRPPPQTSEIERPKKIASPEKPSPLEPVLSSTSGMHRSKLNSSRPASDLLPAKEASGLVKPILPRKVVPALPARQVSDCYDDRNLFGSKNLIEALMKGMAISGNTTLARCKNSLQLATKLLDPSFRLEFFAHATEGIFEVLRDAAGDVNLSLSLAAVVIVLSTDSLKMSVDRNALRLMASIMDKGAAAVEKLNQEIVESVVAVIGRSKFSKDLSRDIITAPRLMIEALLTMKLGSQLAWFIVEVGQQGLIELVTSHLVMVLPQLREKPTMAKLNAIHRISEFFYKVMHNNKENSLCLVENSNSAGFTAVVSAINFCVTQLSKKTLPVDLRNEVGVVLRSLLSLLVNLTGHADKLRSQMGARAGLMESLIRSCFELDGVLARDKAQEILIRALLCIVNLTFNCDENCKVFLETKPINPTKKTPNLLLFVELLKKTSDDAVTSAADLDRCTDQYDRMIRAMEQDADVTITDVLDKAGENMEHYAIMCYDGLVLGHLVMQEDAEDQLKGLLKDVFGSVPEGIAVATDAIKRMTDFITDAKAENVHPVNEMQATVDALENYSRRYSS